ncbi:hypothetical protein WICMUC_004739 [Wickerhamomyces mucosus]|uniref:PH domain-containing protein n=1 Tax=Wickerhamomyces mucosus TaxID=1378264 RepID=A0A9P8PFR3_9ASCO|nr:hypothetical protein WICMUC_004739 [Wickerhamomyces mucosus]
MVSPEEANDNNANSRETGLYNATKSIEEFSNYYELSQVKNSILNLAIQVSPIKLITKLLDDTNALALDINYQDSNGNTPLHLAVLNNRIDAVQLLLKDYRINDTILNDDMKQPIELTSENGMIELLQLERSKYIEKIANEFRIAFTQHDFAKLDEILAFQRNHELLDINGNDPETGDNVLHEFIKKNDIGMVKWILSHGGDPFIRDKKGRLPIDLVFKPNEALRQLLLESSKEQSVIDSHNPKSSGNSAPTFKGYLKKWTNFASGYKLRWFVLDSHGILSYYRSQEDTNNACRGSLNMKYALLHLDSSEKLKFEIIGKGGVRFHLMGNHPVETNRWVWSLQGAIRYSKDKDRDLQKALIENRKRLDKDLEPKASHISQRNVSYTNEASDSNFTDKKNDLISNRRENYYNDSDDEDEQDSESDSGVEFDSEQGPYAQEISVLKSRFSVELKTLKEILVNLKSTPLHTTETVEVSINTVNSLISEFTDYSNYVNKRDEQLIKSLRKQKNINELWINSIRELENELLEKTSELQTFELERRKIKKVLSKKFNISSPVINNAPDFTPKEKAVENTAEEELSKIFQGEADSEDEFFDADEFTDEEEEDHEERSDYILDKLEEEEEEEGDTFTEDNANKEENTEIHKDIEVDVQTLAERNLNETAEVATETYSNELQRAKFKHLEDEGSFLGYYEPPRTDFPLKIDSRPRVSLWGILKSMIGKDLTKIALPVAFNEPTSLLQRLTEDLEYSYLLDQAATFEDSSLRLLYISAFAASAYSSTVDRVAKPFNPLLGETFEYSRPDFGFRYIAEQVSHHPPITAMLTESPKWDYHGEASVKSGFNGRSFDVQPLGTWYLKMRPDNSAEEEVYSWKKIATSVIGIMVGSPSIDNYGDMVIVNNKTGDEAHLTFKPRGWRASQAYEMSGHIQDKDGNKRWTIGGHWNSKIYGKKVVVDNAKGDASLEDSNSSPNGVGSKFLLWQASTRPLVPFNLTDFAVTLNDPKESLKEYLSDSDSRLRPDQRAMENGYYDDADVFKREIEEMQRARRKDREERGIVYQPRFFEKANHEITNEEYWKYRDNYWNKRATKELPSSNIF